MSTPSHVGSDDESIGESLRAGRHAAAIAASVLRVLGKPADLFRVAVVRLWDNRYRVNVQTGPDAASVRVAHSFFVEVNEAGAVLASAPAIVRVY